MARVGREGKTTSQGSNKLEGRTMSENMKKEKQSNARRWTITLVIVLALIVLCLIFCPKLCCTGKLESKAPAPVAAVDTVKPIAPPAPATEPVEAQEPEFTVASLTPVAADVQQHGYLEDASAFNQLLEQALAQAKEEKASKLAIPAAGARFLLGKADLSQAGHDVFAAFAKAFMSTNQQGILLVEGYGCDLGGSDVNDEVSQARCRAVKEVLLQAGVPEGKIETHFYGKTKYNQLPGVRGREANRRVNVSVK